MDDVRIWRVAINGYPYRSPEELGVYDKFDAFVATKQAIYSIIYGTDATTYYKGGDARGEAIKNVVVKLVDIGRNGSQTPVNTNITVEKVNSFYEDGIYYSQEYRINTPVETSQYTITQVSGIPEGAKITDLAGNEKTTFSGTENFKVQIPKDKLSSDINITINVKGKSKTYPVFYGATRIPGTQDYLVTYDAFGDTTGKTDLNIKTNTGKVQVIKTDDETFKPIENVTFGLYKKDGTEVARATTNSKGIVEFKNLYQNSYVLKELSTNNNYILSKVEFDVNVEYNKTTKVEVENEHKKGNIKVYKVDKDNNKIALGNVEFDLYSVELDKIIGTYKTSVDGEIYIENIRTRRIQADRKKYRKMVQPSRRYRS